MFITGLYGYSLNTIAARGDSLGIVGTLARRAGIANS